MSNNNAAELVHQSVMSQASKIQAKKSNGMKINAGVIGVGAAGGNVASLLTQYGYDTAAFNTTESDMVGLTVGAKIVMQNINGSGKDRAFASTQFKRSYKTFFAHNYIEKLVENDLIFVVGSGGGGTGTILSVMIAGFLKSEYPNKTIIAVGLLGSIKEDKISQENIREYMSDVETKLNTPYLLFDNNKVKGKVGTDVYTAVNDDAVYAIRVLTKEFFIENNRSNIDGRDYARLTSFKGLMSVIPIDDLNISVTEESIDLVSRLNIAAENTSAVVTGNPEAYGFFMNVSSEVYSSVDITFESVQKQFGYPTSGLAFKHLQDESDNGPAFAMIMTGCESPLERFKMVSRRIEEYEATKEKATLPHVDRKTTSLNLAGDDSSSETGAGAGFFDSF